MLNQQVELAGSHVFRIGFDAPFGVDIQGEAFANDAQKTLQLWFAQMRGSSASQKNGSHVGAIERRQFAVDGQQEAFDPVIAIGHDAEVAVPAAVTAERDVQIG